MLKTDTLYVVNEGDETFWVRTPDGEGTYWYNQFDPDALTDVEPVKSRLYFNTSEDFDNYRHGG